MVSGARAGLAVGVAGADPNAAGAMTPGCSTSEARKLSLRTLVGEHHGLAVALTHGGLLWNSVQACLVMHSGMRRGRCCCGRGDKDCLWRGRCEVGRLGESQGRAGAAGRKLLSSVLALLNTTDGSDTACRAEAAGSGQELHGSLKGGSHF